MNLCCHDGRKFEIACQIPQNKRDCAICCWTISLALLSLIELYALLHYNFAFVESSSDGCCGVISTKSEPFDGAQCFEEDITNGKIEKQIVNDSVLCVVEGTTCDGWYPQTNPIGINMSNYTDLSDCVNYSGYELNDICGSYKIDTKAETNAFEGVMWSIFAIVFILISIGLTMSEYIGCWHPPNMKQKDGHCWRCVLKVYQVFVWIYLLVMVEEYVENPAKDGYDKEKYFGYDEEKDEVIAYIYNVCGLPNNVPLLWADYDFTAPDFVKKNTYEIFTAVGILLSLIDIGLCIYVLCQERRKIVEDEKIKIEKKKKAKKE